MRSPSATNPDTGRPRFLGQSSPTAFAWWDRGKVCWRRLAEPARPDGEGVAEFCDRWPPCGMTVSGLALAVTGSGHEAISRGARTWPTPKVTTNRSSRRSITREGHWSAPGLEQAAEISEGILPREVRRLAEIRSPAARALWPAAISEPSNWGTPRASSGMTSQLRDPARIADANGRLEDQVALAEGRAGGWLNPEWVEWLMGFPAGWTHLSADEEAARVAAPGAARVAARTFLRKAAFAHHDTDRRTRRTLRSPCHPEAGS